MRNALAIARKDWRLMMADRAGLLTSLIVPVILASLFGLAFAGAGSVKERLKIAFVDDDQTPLSAAFGERLKTQDGVALDRRPLTEAEHGLRQGTFAAVVVIPRGFADRSRVTAAGGAPARVELHLDPSQKIPAAALRGLLLRTGWEEHAIASTPPGTPAPEPPISIEEKPYTPREGVHPSSFAIEFPALTAMFVLFGSMSGALAFVREKNTGTMRRLLQSPVTRGDIIFGKMLAIASTGVLQGGVMFLSAGLLFGVWPNGSGLGLAIMIVLTATAGAALAMFFASMGESEGMVHGVSLLLILIMSALGGSMFPLVLMPEWMQTLAGITLNKWSIDGFNSVVWRGEGLAAIVPNAFVLLGYSAILFVAGRRMFRWRV